MEKKILIIDDDADITRYYQVILEDHNYSVSSADNSTDGMSKLLQDDPDLLILDIMMDTNLEGYGIAHKVKENPRFRDLPIIVISGMMESLGVNFEDAIEDVGALPNVHFLHKPVQHNVLTDKISELVV